MSENTYDEGREAGEFTEEESRIHQGGFKIIHEGLKRGLAFDTACEGLQVVEPEMRRIIVDDYLKVTVAEQHFQQGVALEKLAEELKVAVGKLETVKGNMLREVQEAASKFYRSQSGGGEFSMEDGGGSEEKKEH